jgi:hypothetical protein
MFDNMGVDLYYNRSFFNMTNGAIILLYSFNGMTTCDYKFDYVNSFVFGNINILTY